MKVSKEAYKQCKYDLYAFLTNAHKYAICIIFQVNEVNCSNYNGHSSDFALHLRMAFLEMCEMIVIEIIICFYLPPFKEDLTS